MDDQPVGLELSHTFYVVPEPARVLSKIPLFAHSFDEIKGAPFANNCVVSGPAFSTPVVGIPTSFYVHARDMLGADVFEPTVFSVTVQSYVPDSKEGHVFQSGVITSDSSATAQASFVPTHAGRLLVHVRYKNVDVVSSPFLLHVQETVKLLPSAPRAPPSVATGRVFAAVLCGDRHATAALVLAQSLRDVQSSAPFVALLGPRVTSPTIAVLHSAGIATRLLPVAPSCAALRLGVLSLEGFQEVVLLGIATVITANIDDSFSAPAFDANATSLDVLLTAPALLLRPHSAAARLVAKRLPPHSEQLFTPPPSWQASWGEAPPPLWALRGVAVHAACPPWLRVRGDVCDDAPASVAANLAWWATFDRLCESGVVVCAPRQAGEDEDVALTAAVDDQDIAEWIWAHQHPVNCAQQKFLVVDLQRGGLGSQIQGYAWAMLEALNMGRVLLIKKVAGTWNYAGHQCEGRTIDCYFKSESSCPLPPEVDDDRPSRNSALFDEATDSNPAANYFDPAIRDRNAYFPSMTNAEAKLPPFDEAMSILSLQFPGLLSFDDKHAQMVPPFLQSVGLSAVWRVMQQFFWRVLPERLQSRDLGVPYISMHVRHERNIDMFANRHNIPFEVYLHHARRLKQAYGVNHIVLSTDNASVAEQARDVEDFVFEFNDDTVSYNINTVELNVVQAGVRDEAFANAVEAINGIDFLSKGQWFIGSCMSQFSRVVANLMTGRGIRRSPPVAVDYHDCNAYPHRVPINEEWTAEVST